MKQTIRNAGVLVLLVSGAYLFSGCSEEPVTGPIADGQAYEQRHHDAIKAPLLGNQNDNGTNGNDNGTNGNDNGTNGNDNGTNGNDNGTNGNDNGTNGNDNGTNGNDNGTNGNDNGTNGNDNGTNGNDNGTNGNDNGTNGNDNGTNGNDNGTNGNDNGTNGNDNGTNGNDNGTNGNDNGTNGNDNGTNGNDNGTNGNDNGTNGNDNGTNGNDNGTNGNDNGGGGTCPDGSTQLYTEMGGSDDNRVEYQVFADGCEHFRARVRDLAPYTAYDVVIEGVSVGTIQTDDDGRGELRYQGSFPSSFPEVFEGDRVTVGPVSGTFGVNCSNSNCNG